jgi:hypothetical protein
MSEVQYGSSQEDVLKKQNLVTETQLVKAKAVLYNIQYFDLDASPASPEALSVLPQEVAQKFNVFPVSIDRANKMLTLVMSDPMKLTAIEFIERKANLRVKPVIAEVEKIIDAINIRYTSLFSSYSCFERSCSRKKIKYFK